MRTIGHVIIPRVRAQIRVSPLLERERTIARTIGLVRTIGHVTRENNRLSENNRSRDM